MSQIKNKTRLDSLLVIRNFCDSTDEADRLLLAGQIHVAGLPHPKPGDIVDKNIEITTEVSSRYVSRGGHKLEAALEHFKIDPTGLVCLDIGSSTGGFTDCLLQHGASHVIALDSGTNQMAWKIRSDKRVTVHEKFNARLLSPDDIKQKVDLITVDVSFISLTLVLPPACKLLSPNRLVVALIKPQFELEKKMVSPGGVVIDPILRAKAVDKIRNHATNDLACEWVGCISSPLLGSRSGNEEFLACFKKL